MIFPSGVLCGAFTVAWVVGCLAQASFASAAERPAARLLVIGVDGCRTDALRSGQLPNLRALIAQGAFSDATNILGSRNDGADTVSGPGWSNVLTGVWPDKHGVMNNKFSVMHFDRYPHFFSHLKAVFPGAKTCSYVTWAAIHDHIVSAADTNELFSGDDKQVGYERADAQCAEAAADMLRRGDPDAMFVYLGEVDEAGHAQGFHPSVVEYRDALQTVDGHVGRVLAAMRSRPNFAAEHWLVLVATDHGGVGTGHGGGRKKPEVNTVWMIVSGDGAEPGSHAGATNQVDVVATALAHLGVSPRPDWRLDGRPVGLKRPIVAQ